MEPMIDSNTLIELYTFPSSGFHLCMDPETEHLYIEKLLSVGNPDVYRQLMGLHNIHIPTVYACEVREQQLCILEDYIPGQTLEEALQARLSAGGPLWTEAEAASVLLQLCDALTLLHQQTPPIIHRDIKLSNIILGHDGLVHLIDYNAARRSSPDAAQDTELLGTAGYAAPEQFGFRQTDARTDIYALGIVFHYLLTGKHIREGQTQGAAASVIRTCTMLDPERRYGDVSALAVDLQKLAAFGNQNSAASGTGSEVPGKDSESEHSVRTDSAQRAAASFGHLFWPLPGFRQKKVFHMLTALAIYAFILWSTMREAEHYMGPLLMKIVYKLGTCSWMLFVFALLTDYAGLAGVLGLKRDMHPLFRLLAYTGLILLSFFAVTALSLILNTFL